MSERNFPLPRPDSDPRFTFGLVHDVGKLLEAAGYPAISGVDRVGLQLALFRFLYKPLGTEELDGRQDDADQAPATSAVPDDSPLTLAEYRSALGYWERKAFEAQAAGLRGEFDRRMEGIVTLRKSIRRLEDNASGYTEAQLDWVACSECGLPFADDEITAQGPPAPDGRFLRAHPDCLTDPTSTEPPGDAS